jgi:hypothetical protein
VAKAEVVFEGLEDPFDESDGAMLTDRTEALLNAELAELTREALGAEGASLVAQEVPWRGVLLDGAAEEVDQVRGGGGRSQREPSGHGNLTDPGPLPDLLVQDPST